MRFLEKDLEQIIYETPNEKLKDKGLLIDGKKLRQLKLGNYGIPDIITYKRGDWADLDVSIYELKKDKIGISAYLQALNYWKGIDEYLDKRGLSCHFQINLIGCELDTSGSFCYLPDFDNKIRFYTYDYDFDGIKFTRQSGYKLTDNGFNLY